MAVWVGIYFCTQTGVVPYWPQIKWLISTGVHNLDDIHISEIDDLASEDAFQRTIAILQLAWFALQCTGRAIDRQKFSLFEVTTLSFVTGVMFSMFLWWEKPSGVSARIKIETASIKDHEIDKMSRETRANRETLQLRLRTSSTELETDIELSDRWILIPAILLRLVDRAWRLAAWNYAFPTVTEALLWKRSSSASVALLIVLIVGSEIDASFHFFGSWYTPPVGILMCFYVVCRTYFIVETIIFTSFSTIWNPRTSRVGECHSALANEGGM